MIDWKMVFSGIIGGIVGALIVLFLFPKTAAFQAQSLPLNIGDVRVALLPPNSEVVYKDETVAERIRLLEKRGTLFTFQACTRGSEIGEKRHFQEAFEISLSMLSKFLNSTVKTFSKLAKIQNTEFYTRMVKIVSHGVTSGSRIIAKYKYFDGISYNFCVITLYDPLSTLSLATVKARLKKIAQEYGIRWEEFNEKLLEAYKSAYSPSP